jgi:hypothetical protein
MPQSDDAPAVDAVKRGQPGGIVEILDMSVTG